MSTIPTYYTVTGNFGGSGVEPQRTTYQTRRPSGSHQCAARVPHHGSLQKIAAEGIRRFYGVVKVSYELINHYSSFNIILIMRTNQLILLC